MRKQYFSAKYAAGSAGKSSYPWETTVWQKVSEIEQIEHQNRLPGFFMCQFYMELTRKKRWLSRLIRKVL